MMSEPMTVTVHPAATGHQVVRVSLPLKAGILPQGKVLVARSAAGEAPTAVRVLTWHPAGAPRSVRRAMVTWICDFPTLDPVEFALDARDPADAPLLPPRLPVACTVRGEEVTVTWEGGPIVTARLIAPPAVPAAVSPRPPVETHVVESHGLCRWERVVIPDPQFPRVIEIRTDAVGQVVLVGHVQRNLPGNDYAPDLGWELDFRHLQSRLAPEDGEMRAEGETVHRFETGEPCVYHFESPGHVIYHPAAPYRRKGSVAVRRAVNRRTSYRYLRAEAGDLTPWQQSAWRRFEAVIAPEGVARLTPALACPHTVAVGWQAWDALYQTGAPPQRPRPELAEAIAHSHDLVLLCAADGDDWGNIISYDENTRAVGTYAMNRLNHCPPIFFEGWRTGDRRLVEAAVLWCENFHDLTIWWGPQYTGGTRYNWGPAVDHHPPQGDPTHFCWRSNRTVDFCTKGYDAFFLAYEETGDPRMLHALEAQVSLAGQLVHADRGECRNIGDVRDLTRLYHYTGERRYLDHALRLFRELTTRLWPNGLFSQDGTPETPVLPFIDNDADGYPHGYAKAYILGYALAGLPELLQTCPDEPRLQEVVQAVADFLAESQDPAGGWRYPHPRSSGLGLGNMEHAWHIVQAAHALGAQEGHLEAIERVLRANILGWLRAGLTVSGLSGWERATGTLRPGQTLQDLYDHPEDRDGTRDYDEGDLGFGSVSPDSVVYFPEVLAFYLRQRPAERLLAPPADHEPLGRILRRLPNPRAYQTEGVRDLLPIFRDKAVRRMRYPLSWLSGSNQDFARWRRDARAKVMECLLAPPPPAAFAPRVLAEEDRGTYVAQKLAVNLTADSRVLAYLLVPKGREGPLPAMICLQGHNPGMHLSIGQAVDERGQEIALADRDYAIQAVRNGFVALALEQDRPTP